MSVTLLLDLKIQLEGVVGSASDNEGKAKVDSKEVILLREGLRPLVDQLKSRLAESQQRLAEQDLFGALAEPVKRQEGEIQPLAYNRPPKRQAQGDIDLGDGGPLPSAPPSEIAPSAPPMAAAPLVSLTPDAKRPKQN